MSKSYYYLNITQIKPNYVIGPLWLINIEINTIEAINRNSLYDSNLKRYVPCALPSVQFFPNLGVMYRIVQGCNWTEAYRKLPVILPFYRHSILNQHDLYNFSIS